MKYIILSLLFVASIANAAGGKWFGCEGANGNVIGPYIFYPGSAKVSQICNNILTKGGSAPTQTPPDPMSGVRQPEGREALGLTPEDALGIATQFILQGYTSFNDPVYRDIPVAWQVELGDYVTKR